MGLYTQPLLQTPPKGEKSTTKKMVSRKSPALAEATYPKPGIKTPKMGGAQAPIEGE